MLKKTLSACLGRPFLVVALLAVLRLTVASGGLFWWLSLCLCFFCLEIFTKGAYRRSLLCILAATMVLSFLFSKAEEQREAVAGLAGHSLSLSARVVAPPKIYETQQRARVKMLWTSPFETYVYLPLGPLKSGDIIEGEFTFYAPSVMDGFDRAQYYLGESIFVLGKTPSFSLLGHEKSLVTLGQGLTLRLIAFAEAHLSQRAAAMVRGVCFGDTDGLTKNDYLTVQKSGIAHTMSVSGMHIGFLVSLFVVVFGKRWGSLFSLFGIFFFACMVGFSPSILRAGILHSLWVLGFFLYKESDSVNSLSAALVIILAASPYAIFSLGLQLSFASTLGIVLFASRLRGLLLRGISWRLGHRLCAPLAAGLACSLCSMVFTAPLLLTSFGYVSLLAPLANLLVLAPLSLFFLLGLCGLVLGLGFAPLMLLLSPVLEGLSAYILWAAGLVSALPFSVLLGQRALSPWILALFYGGLALCLGLGLRPRYFLLLGLACYGFGALSAFEKDMIYIEILPSGYGQGLLIYSSEAAAIIDCRGSGGRDMAALFEERLRLLGISDLDVAVVTALDKTHAGQLAAFLETTPVAQLVLPKDSKPSPLKDEIFALCKTKEMQILETDSYLFTPLELFAQKAAEGKFLAGAGDVLSLHSLTANMLLAFTEDKNIKSHTVILPDKVFADAEKIKAILGRISAKRLITDGVFSSHLFGGDMTSVMESGMITHKITKGGQAQWQQIQP